VPIAIEEHGGAFAENSFAEAPFASEKSEPFFITVNTVANVSVTGVEATAQSNGVVFNATVNLTGLEATASVGDATVSLPTSISVTGLEATMPVLAIDSGGSLFGGISFSEEPFAELEDTGLKVIIQTGSGVPVTGVEATGDVGSVAINSAANVPVTGVSATGEVDSVSVIGEANVSVVGVSADALKPNNGSAFTANGNAQLSTAQAKFGPSSLLLDGTDDFVTSDDNIDLSSGDFTVDMWIRPTNVTGYKGIWQTGTSTTEQSYLLGNQVYWVVNPSTIISSSVTVSAGVWTMLSYEREGNVHRIYKNGTLEDTFTTANKPDNGVFSVGKNGFGDFDGYIDEVRLSSVARYEGTSFTEPTANYAVDGDTTALLHFDGANGSTDIVNETEGVRIVEGTGVNVAVNSPRLQGSVGVVQPNAQIKIFVVGVAGTGETSGASVVSWNEINPNQDPNWKEIAA
jgi:hypothetical protein